MERFGGRVAVITNKDQLIFENVFPCKLLEYLINAWG